MNIDGYSNPSKALQRKVQINKITGPHPGNTGIQIHHIDPINDDIIWYLTPQDVLTIATLFVEGRYDARELSPVGPK